MWGTSSKQETLRDRERVSTKATVVRVLKHPFSVRWENCIGNGIPRCSLPQTSQTYRPGWSWSWCLPDFVAVCSFHIKLQIMLPSMTKLFSHKHELAPGPQHRTESSAKTFRNLNHLVDVFLREKNCDDIGQDLWEMSLKPWKRTCITLTNEKSG